MIRVRQVKIRLEEDNSKTIKKKLSHLLSIKEEYITDYKIIKKSLDARNKEAFYYIYELDVNTPKEDYILKKNHSLDIFKSKEEKYQFPKLGNLKMTTRPVIVGSGPAGLFCAYLLALYGYKPLVIERGEDVDTRVKTIEKFWKTGTLNKDSNVQFGEGGAGTFSDGKLNTLSKDKSYRNKKVFEIFVENGADPEIMYIYNPHIGTDALRTVIKNIRNKIISLGGSFSYNTKLTDLKIEDGTLEAIVVNEKETIPCHTLVLAIGHSARDTYHLLAARNIIMTPKPFALGVRIEHNQDMINTSQYGKYKKYLPPASYKLTYTTTSSRGVYSFCMCPGGFVVNASSEEARLAINGMSNHNRAEENANSALVVTIGPKDYGEDLFAGVKYQQKLESLAYKYGNGLVPVQLYGDFLKNEKSTSFKDVKPVHKGATSFANLNDFLPEFVTSSLKEAIPVFAKKIKGYDDPSAILSAIETRTSSPIRICRDDNFESNIKGIYPCGEGAGFAGGITTAAMDGIKIAEEIAKKYQPF